MVPGREGRPKIMGLAFSEGCLRRAETAAQTSHAIGFSANAVLQESEGFS
jgi:hypothetical protein